MYVLLTKTNASNVTLFGDDFSSLLLTITEESNTRLRVRRPSLLHPDNQRCGWSQRMNRGLRSQLRFSRLKVDHKHWLAHVNIFLRPLRWTSIQSGDHGSPNFLPENYSKVNQPSHLRHQPAWPNIFRAICPIAGGRYPTKDFYQIHPQIRLPSENLYGIGENEQHGFRHNFTTWKVLPWFQTSQVWPLYARDQPPAGEPIYRFNMYGVHPRLHQRPSRLAWLSTRYTLVEDDGSTHAVIFINSNAQEFETFPLPGLIYRTIVTSNTMFSKNLSSFASYIIQKSKLKEQISDFYYYVLKSFLQGGS